MHDIINKMLVKVPSNIYLRLRMYDIYDYDYDYDYLVYLRLRLRIYEQFKIIKFFWN